MKKYKIQLNDKKTIGPLSESDVSSLIRDEKINRQSLVQLHPDGNWKELATFIEFRDLEATFIKKLDLIKEEEDTDDDLVEPIEVFPEEFKFEKKDKPAVSEELDKTVIISHSEDGPIKPENEETDEDKTQINASTLKYIEELKKHKKKEEIIELEKETISESKIDMKNDETQLIDLEEFKNDLADEIIETELTQLS